MKPAARPMVSRTRVLALVTAASALSACTLRGAPPVAPPSPHDSCSALNDSLNAAVAPGQSLAELQARGIRMRTPLSLPPGTSPATAQPSGAAVQALIGVDGRVVAGSPRTLKSIGEAQIANAVEAGALSMSFDFDAGVRPGAPIPFTTTYASCARS
jgi:hypothetical protein